MRSGGRGVVTLLTDFGDSDGYVAAMKGVILTHAPAARIVDAGHGIPPQDIRAAAWALKQYWRFYPPGTVHVAVVDPGVGSARRALCCRADGRYLVGPDNGIFTWVLKEAGAVSIRTLRPSVHSPGEVSATFHGRDIFAYAAARLAARPSAFTRMTQPSARPILPEWAEARKDGPRLHAKVVHVDTFGNCITGIRASDLPRRTRLDIRMGRARFDCVRKTYADVPPQRPVAIIGSSGHLEIAINQGSAARRFAAIPGTSFLVVL